MRTSATPYASLLVVLFVTNALSSTDSDETAGDIRGFRWGDLASKVLEKEAAKRGQPFSDAFPTYEVSLAGGRARLNYSFGSSERLESASYTFDSDVTPESGRLAILSTQLICDRIREL